MRARNPMIAACIIVATLASTICSAAEDTAVLELDVTVPASTPADAKVFLAGNLPAVGNWRPDGTALQKQDNGHWRATLRLPKGRELQYKFTLGSWAGVEKGK